MARRAFESGGQVYLIVNMVTGRRYVGQTTKSLHSRFQGHCYDADKGRTACLIHRAIAKYGADSFSVERLEQCRTREELNASEAFWIRFFNSLSPNGYNLAAGGGVKGISDETRARMSAAAKLRGITPEQRAKMTAATVGIVRGPQSPAHRAAIGRSNAGKVRSDEVREALARRERAPLSEDARLKISNALKGRDKSAATREKLASANRGKKASDEARVAMSLAHKGKVRKPLSEETKTRIGAANRQRHAERRAKDGQQPS